MNWQLRSTEAVPHEPPMLMPEIIWQIAARRGYKTKEDIERLIHPRLRDLAHPFSLDQMDVAVERLLLALQNGEKILLYGDYDLDGTPGLALLKDGFSRLGFHNLVTFQPSRRYDGYGLHANRLAEFHSQGVSLVVTVDVGITDIETVQIANALHLDVIITDHHLPKEGLPKALAVLNPNKGTCSSRLQHLCGAGVAFYLVLALRMEMSRRGLRQSEFDPKELLDLFALATITDMVPLINENRVLVKHGLLQLSQPKRPGLKRLFMELGYYNKKISSQDVAFRIAPKLNALTRLEEGICALDVLTADEENAKRLVDEALLINQRRVFLQEKAKKISLELLKDCNTEKFIWIHSHEFHPGVVSLIASDLMNQYKVPAFVGSVHEDGRVTGSARAPSEKYNLQNILKSAESALQKFGGHQLAAGFEINKENSERLRSLLHDFFKDSDANGSVEKDGYSESHGSGAQLNVAASEAPVFYDAEVKLSILDAHFMNWYESLGPFGVQFEAPKLLLRKVNIESVRRLKGSALKYSLTDSETTIEAPWFSPSHEFPKGSQVDVLFEPQWNEYNGRRTLQAMIYGMKPH